MKELTVKTSESGQTLIKYLARIMNTAPNSFFYKMLRKKNITLNNKKADGHEIISAGDVIKVFVSDETFDKFVGKTCSNFKIERDILLDVIYEDDNILLINKPVGILSQKSIESDISINEYCINYLIKNGSYNPEEPGAFKPSVCNRLDRNTTGIIIVAKTLICAREVNKALKQRTLHKYYVCLCKGIIGERLELKGKLEKDEVSNKVYIDTDSDSDSNGSFIETNISPIRNNGRFTLAEVELLTGKSHQIRAHLASIGHPLLGDNKYGDTNLNKKLNLKYQMLHSYKIVMPKFDGEMQYLSEKTFEIDIPKLMIKLMEKDNGDVE